MLISLEQLIASAHAACARAQAAALVSKLGKNERMEAFQRGQVHALETLLGAYRMAIEQGRLVDLGATLVANGAAVALAVERISLWLASMAKQGGELAEVKRAAQLRADLAQSWLDHGP